MDWVVVGVVPGAGCTPVDGVGLMTVLIFQGDGTNAGEKSGENQKPGGGHGGAEEKGRWTGERNGAG